MFDRAQAPRQPTAWQADPALLDGAAVSDFAPWRIQPLQGDLSDLSRAALARFEAEQATPIETDDASHAPALPVEPFKPGLPSVVTHFVPDVHVPIGQTLRDTAAAPTPPTLQQDAPAEAAPEATPAAADATELAASEDGPAEPSAAMPDADDTASEDTASEDTEASAAPDAADADPEPSDAPERAARPEEDTAPEATEADLADDDVIAAHALAEAERERAESLAAQAQPAGIDPDEVARREAEQYQLGREDGERAAREAMEQEVNAQRTVLAGVAQELHALLQNPTEFFEPLKRLALHVAEQITLTQWQSSTQTLEALIRRCMDTLDHANQGAVVVELHPLDVARLQQAAPELIRGMRLDANDALRVGSVRLYANDAVVEDLIEHRLAAIVHSLHVDAEAWQQRSLLLRDPRDDRLPALVLPDAAASPEADPEANPEAAPEADIPAATDHADPSAAKDDDVHP